MLAERLARFEEQVQLWVRLGLGAALAILLAASFILMGVGAYRLIRAHKEATPSFGSAFACLAACLGIVFAAGWLGPISDAPLANNERTEVKMQDHLARLAQGPKVKDIPDKIPTGTYGLRRERLTSRNNLTPPSRPRRTKIPPRRPRSAPCKASKW